MPTTRPRILRHTRYLTAPQLARRYRVTMRQVYYAFQHDLIPYTRVGRQYIVDVNDLPDSWPTS